jgi:hypothetical protein
VTRGSSAPHAKVVDVAHGIVVVAAERMTVTRCREEGGDPGWAN